MSETPIVNQEEEVIVPQDPVEEVTPTDAPPGAKTDSALLLDSLQKERDKRRELERELEALKITPEPTTEYSSDEGQALKSEINSIKEKLALSELNGKYPQLKDKSSEFEDFRLNPENRGMSIATAAKAFLAENGLLNQPAPPRKGLESDTGGGRAPVKTGRTEEEIADLRTSNFRQYSKELRAGTLRA